MSTLLLTRRLAGGAASGGVGGSASRYFRAATVNAELPRGVSSNYNLLFDESTQTLTTVGGSSYSYLWDWANQRVGSARHAAATQLTVAGTGSTAWTNFLSAVSTFSAGSGDYEILVPAAMTMSGQWTVPTVSGDRRLFITYNGSLPTANTMPTTTALSSCSVWTGMAGTASSLIAIDGATAARITLTGIVLKPQNQIAVGVIDYRTTGTVTTMADVPTGLVLDRCWLDGSGTTNNCRRGLALNGQQFAVLETWVTDIRMDGSESSGIGGWTGSRYGVIRNVMSESRSIGILWGGADPNNAGSGNCDPSDILSINVACTKKASWMTENAGSAVDGIKNGFEAKNCVRWFIWNCITYRHANTGQSHAMLFQNLQDTGDTNSAANRVDDIVVHNHELREIQNGLNLLSRVAYGSGTLPTNTSTRLAFDNVRLIDLGKNFGAAGYQSNPVQLLQDLNTVLLDRWTWVLYSSALDDQIRVDTSSRTGTNWMLTNLAGRARGFFGSTSGGAARTGLTCLSEATGGTYTWSGNSMYGPFQYGGTHTPGVTQYSLGGTLAADAAAMGFNTTTGVLSSPSTDDGVGGTTPGCDHTQLDAGLLSMQSWAFSR